MGTMTRLILAALAGAAALLAWLWIAAALRRDDDVPDEDGVQPWDAYAVTLADGGGSSVEWLN